MRGLGRVTDVLSQALFPVAAEATEGLDPRTVKAMQRQSLLQLGLGMMAAKNQGAGLGQGLNFAFNQAQQDMNQGLGQALLSKRANREDKRLDLQERRLDEGLGLQREAIARQQEDAARQQQNWERQFGANQANTEADNRRQDEVLALQKRMASMGGQEGVNMQRITRPASGGKVQDFGWNPRTNQMVPIGEPYRPVTNYTGNPSEGERVSANYAGRMENAEKLLGDYQPGFKDYVAGLQVMKGGAVTSAAANAAMSAEGQKYYQAAADWVRAKLRKESGAVISPDEMAQEIKTYFPVPGDSPETIRQKKAARDQAFVGMKEMAGRAVPPSSVGGREAPAEALQFLQQNPDSIDFFEQKYGYRPDGF